MDVSHNSKVLVCVNKESTIRMADVSASFRGCAQLALNADTTVYSAIVKSVHSGRAQLLAYGDNPVPVDNIRLDAEHRGSTTINAANGWRIRTMYAHAKHRGGIDARSTSGIHISDMCSITTAHRGCFTFQCDLTMPAKAVCVLDASHRGTIIGLNGRVAIAAGATLMKRISFRGTTNIDKQRS
jgi:hypothetical protein